MEVGRVYENTGRFRNLEGCEPWEGSKSPTRRLSEGFQSNERRSEGRACRAGMDLGAAALAGAAHAEGPGSRVAAGPQERPLPTPALVPASSHPGRLAAASRRGGHRAPPQSTRDLSGRAAEVGASGVLSAVW